MNPFKLRQLSWINIFARDIMLAIVLLGLFYLTDFKSTTVYFIAGMLLVWVVWQFSDYLSYIKYFKPVHSVHNEGEDE